MNKKAVVVISFGTSMKRAWELAITPTEKEIEKNFKGYDFYHAITSNFIRAKLEKRGEKILSPEKLLSQLVEEGYQEILIQPLHILPGFEYEKIKEAISKVKKEELFVCLGSPLMSEQNHVEEVAQILITQLEEIQKEHKVFLIGHGTKHPANAFYQKLQNALHAKGSEALVGTIEEGVEEMAAQLKSSSSVLLVPFLFVAGDHVLHDLMGDEEDSWSKKLEALGHQVCVYPKGLGEHEAFQKLYLKRLQEAREERKDV